MPEIDSKNHFYLGREHDLAAGETGEADVLYASKDLTTHAICVGMTGSGKTGLCLSLIEEAALDGVPVIAIDPKGDLGNLLLSFPDLEASSFRPWVDESAAARKGLSPEEFAENTAQLWKNGLASWGQGPERMERYNDSVEKLIFTPGSSSGIPMTVLKSFDAPPKELIEDRDAFSERVSSAVSGLLTLLGIDADPVRSREHIFLSNILTTAWQAGKNLDIAEMIREIQQPPFDKVGVMDLESFFPAKDRLALSMDLNNLLASPSFAGWMQGQPLNVDQLLYAPADGESAEKGGRRKPRLSIISIAHLDDSQRMFFVTILLNEVLAWMRTQPGTSSLRALLYMDEVFGYFPPVGNPPSKQPMLTLLKQARAFGLGCVLATQNPVDLDYKGLSNCGTWLLGRLQTERDKARVIEGLEGASAQAGSGFDKQAMEATLAALGSRVFLMNNVHDDAPVVFHTRWAMSYLCGPLARRQIEKLMDPVRDKIAPPEAESDAATPTAGTKARGRSRRPIVPKEIDERFVGCPEPPPRGCRLEYRAGLIGSAKLHFVKSSVDLDEWTEAWVVKSFNEDLPDGVWDQSLVLKNAPMLLGEPEYDDDDVTFASPPSELTKEKSYKGFERELRDYLYQTQELKLLRCEDLDEVSLANETEQEFRARLADQAAKLGSEAERDIEDKYRSKLQKADERIAKKQAYYDEQKGQFWGRVGGFVWVIIDLALSAIGGKSTRRKSSSSVSAARQAATERGQAQRAKVDLEEAISAKEELERELALALEDAKRKFAPETLELDTVEISPRKSDIDVGQVVLGWLPYVVSKSGAATPAY